MKQKKDNVKVREDICCSCSYYLDDTVRAVRMCENCVNYNNYHKGRFYR